MQDKSASGAVKTEPGTFLKDRAAQVRRFNRFYTRQIGLLRRGFLGTNLSLSEARVLYEIAQADGITARELAAHSGLDQGYLSRVLSDFRRRGLLECLPSREDRRQRPLRLTRAGKREFKVLDERQEREVEATLNKLGPAQQKRLLEAMRTIERMLGDRPRDNTIVLREPRAGDYGWVVSRHGALYAEEYGWDQTFEAFVAKTVAEILDLSNVDRARGWIAEKAGENAGCVWVAPHSDKVAQLRLFLVEPFARRQGLGSRLVAECIQFARRAGYRKMFLWTNSVLVDATRIYRRAGFQLARERKHHSFGKELIGQNWELRL